MSLLGDRLKKAGIDKRSFEQGEIYLAKDPDVKIPDSTLTGRTFHNKRPVVIVFSCVVNKEPLYPVVVAAPLSHDVSRKRAIDLEITAEGSGADSDSLLRLGLIQPFLKIDLEGPVGKLASQQVDQMVGLLIELSGVDLGE